MVENEKERNGFLGGRCYDFFFSRVSGWNGGRLPSRRLIGPDVCVCV